MIIKDDFYRLQSDENQVMILDNNYLILNQIAKTANKRLVEVLSEMNIQKLHFSERLGSSKFFPKSEMLLKL